MYELELFAGAGGGILAQQLLDHRTIGAIEIEPYCRTVLLQRQRDLCLPLFPVWDDVTTFRLENPECTEYIRWLQSISGDLCISGGFPCQDISSCGKGHGITGRKSGLWREMARIIGEIRPAYIFAENSPLLAGRGLDVVLGSLAEMGYDARWCVLGGDDLGYPIIRKRMWILGIRNGIDEQRHGPRAQAGNDPRIFLWSSSELGRIQDADVKRLLADGLVVRTSDGLAGSMEPVHALGNGQIPAVAAVAWQLLTGSLIPQNEAALKEAA